MSILSENLNTYLGSTYNFANILSDFENTFGYIYNIVKANSIININFKKTFSNYPKYPSDFIYVTSTSDINIQKIRECTYDSVDVLLDSIDEDVLNLKYTLDKIPTNLNDMLYDINLQKTYFNDIVDLYDTSTSFLNYFNIQEYSNEVNKCFGEPINTVTDNYHFLQQFMFMFGLVQVLPKMMNLRKQYSDYVISKDIVSAENTITSFNNYLDNNIQDISEHLSDICLRHIYSMVEVSSSLKTLSTTSISSTADKFKEEFSNFLTVLPIDPILEVPKLYHTSLIHSLAIDIMGDIFSGESVIKSNAVIGLQTNLNTILETYLANVDEYNFKSHSFLLYLYKFYPIKFVNILSIIIKDYTENIILPSTENYLTTNEMSTAFFDFCYNKIDYTKLSIYFDNNFNSEKILELSDKYRIYDFTIIFYYLKVMEKFFESDNFQNYIQHVLKTLFDDLFEAGYIDRSFNYRKGYELVHLYLVSHFKYAISSKLLFNDLIDQFKLGVDRCLNNTFDHITGETPTGDINELNVNFTTQFQFNNNSLTVYIDGVEVDPTNYTASGSYHNIRFNIPPTGGNITVDYMPTYLLEFDTDAYLLEKYFKNLTQSKSMVTNILNFTENMCLSTINKQIFLNVLNYFQV